MLQDGKTTRELDAIAAVIAIRLCFANVNFMKGFILVLLSVFVQKQLFLVARPQPGEI
tara:strand:+ start:1966 stop:2139 length:174 start_codon:yes stop_codon:yes gene_type:complete